MDAAAMHETTLIDLLASLKDLLAEIDSFEEIPANLSGATLTIARQRVARAEKQS